MYNKFFTDHPEFQESPVGGKSPERMNCRYDRIIEWNRDFLQNKRILDIGAHDGRWSCAAVDAGAEASICIEPNPKNLERGKKIIDKYNKLKKVIFFEGEWEEYEARMCSWEPHVVFVCGFLYHTYNPVGLMKLISLIQPELVVYDGRIKPAGGIHTKIEGGEGRPALSHKKDVVFIPNWDMMHDIRECYFDNYNMDIYISDGPEGQKDYDNKKRQTFRLVKK
jgi:hypothetical protein